MLESQFIETIKDIRAEKGQFIVVRTVDDLFIHIREILERAQANNSDDVDNQQSCLEDDLADCCENTNTDKELVKAVNKLIKNYEEGRYKFPGANKTINNLIDILTP